MEYWLLTLLIVVTTFVISAFTHYFFKYFNFFKRHGVIHVSMLGALSSVIFCQTSFVEFIRRMYNFNRDAKYIGLYAMTKKILLLRDPELIKAVLTKNFTNSPVFLNFNEYLLTENLLALQNTKWRNMRNVLTPFFSPVKMKIIYALMSKYAIDFAEFMSTLPADKNDVNMKDIFDRYTNDVIALCCYGMEMNSIKNPINRFFISGKEMTYSSPIRFLKYVFIRTFPKLAQIFNIKLLNNQGKKYFETSIKNEILNRSSEQSGRPDMIQLMINNKSKANSMQLDMNDMIAQAYAFYFAGIEPSSGLMSFTVHKIMDNPNVQIKLKQEIDKVLDEFNGNVTYETVNQLEYLHAVLKEALRLFSPSLLERTCERTFELPPALPGEKPFTIKKGMILWISIYAIHHDEKYYDNPEEFCPERFLNNNYDTSYYFPFGLGPKMCIGNRFAILAVKVVLFHLLARCELKPCTKIESQFSKENMLMIPKDGFWLNIRRRDDMHPSLNITT